MKWYIDPAHSSVGFSVRHMMISTVRGRFGRVAGELEYDPPAAKAGRLLARIPAATIDTGEARRDGHLRSADFFDAERYPEITFASTSIEPRGGGRYVVNGTLTIRNVTKPVRFEASLHGIVHDLHGGQRLGASGDFSIDRTEFGLVWNKPIANGVLVGNEVKIELNVAAIDEATTVKLGLAA